MEITTKNIRDRSLCQSMSSTISFSPSENNLKVVVRRKMDLH